MPKYKKESRPGIADADSGGRAAKNIKGGYGPHKGQRGMKYPKKKYPKRKGYSDHGDGYDKKRYEDGGIVGMEQDAKRAAIMKLRQDASVWGGTNLKQHFENGGIVAKVSAKNPKDLQAGLKKAAEIMKEHEEQHEDAEQDLDQYSKEELIEMLKNKY